MAVESHCSWLQINQIVDSARSVFKFPFRLCSIDQLGIKRSFANQLLDRIGSGGVAVVAFAISLQVDGPTARQQK